MQHKDALVTAGHYVNQYVPPTYQISAQRLSNHDSSKFSDEELLPYAKRFIKQIIQKNDFGDLLKYDNDKKQKLLDLEISFNSPEWKQALDHHYAHNDHHLE